MATVDYSKVIKAAARDAELRAADKAALRRLAEARSNGGVVFKGKPWGTTEASRAGIFRAALAVQGGLMQAPVNLDTGDGWGVLTQAELATVAADLAALEQKTAAAAAAVDGQATSSGPRPPQALEAAFDTEFNRINAGQGVGP